MAVSTRITAFAAAAILAAGAAPLAAQEAGEMPVPAVEVSGGYLLMHNTDTKDGYPGGWYFSTVGNVTRWFGVVVEATGSYRSERTTYLSGDVDVLAKDRVQTYMAGGRFFHKSGRFVPFGQMLAGVETRRFRDTITFAEGRTIQSGGRAANKFALQPGAGVTVYLTERIGLRAAVDYCASFDIGDDGVLSEVRYLTGFTFRWGRR
jgi:opacity protein-like surface antigen